MRERTHQGQLGASTAGERADFFVEAQSETARQLLGPGMVVVAEEPLQEAQVRLHRPAAVVALQLADEADILLPFGLMGIIRPAADLDLAAVAAHEAHGAMHGRGLAGAVRADESQHHAGLDLEIERTELEIVISLRNAAQAERRAVLDSHLVHDLFSVSPAGLRA